MARLRQASLADTWFWLRANCCDHELEAFRGSRSQGQGFAHRPGSSFGDAAAPDSWPGAPAPRLAVKKVGAPRRTGVPP